MSAAGCRWSTTRAASSGSIPPATIMPREAGFHWHVGDIIDTADMDRVAEAMADELVAAITQRPMPEKIAQLYLTDPIEALGHIDGIMLSGGVGEYVYGRETRDFGDMGRRLGAAIRARIDSKALPWPLLPAGECIRATALGASEYSVQLSRQYLHHHQSRRAVAAAQSAGGAAALRFHRACRCRRDRCGDPPPPDRLRPRRRRGRGGAGVPLARRARPMSGFQPSPAASASACRRPSPRKSRSTSCSTAMWRRRSARMLREEFDVGSEILAIDGVVAAGLRLCRSRQDPPAVDDRAGDHQIAHFPRGPARRRGCAASGKQPSPP